MSNATPTATPGKTPSPFMWDATLVYTPKPQACSTVNRKNEDLPMSKPNFVPDKDDLSPAYLSSAISEMKELTDKLGIIPGVHGELFKKPLAPSGPLQRSASVANIPERRESALTESDADSSLGILRLDNEPGYSETEDMGVPSEVLSRLQNNFSHISQQTSLLSLLRPSGNGDTSQQHEFNTTSEETRNLVTSVDTQLFPPPDNNTDADLRLRLQKYLAQRTLNQTVDSSVRMSQLNDLIDDSIDSNFTNSLKGLCISKDSHNRSSSAAFPANSSFSLDYNVASLNGSQFVQDSLSESFQPSEVAMARMAQDENSWRRQFGDMPFNADSYKLAQSVPKTADLSTQHLNQNMEYSAFSGVINGDITVNSSLMEDLGKRRISMGEYFSLRTEHLGGGAEAPKDDDRPNFGTVIRSPVRERPHPPLVNISSSQDSPSCLDEIPTRDAGLNTAIGLSFDASLEFSLSAEIEDLLSKDSDSPSKSCNLMGPPSVDSADINPSNIDKVIPTSSRLSTSLPLHINEQESPDNNGDISAISMDTGRRGSGFASISHITRLLNEMPGSISTRCLVDNLIKGNVPDTLRSDFEQGRATSLPDVQGTPVRKSRDVLSELSSNEIIATHTQRINEWMSSLKNSTPPSILDDYVSPDSDQLQQKWNHNGAPDGDELSVKSFPESLKEGKVVSISCNANTSTFENNDKNEQVPHSTPKMRSRTRPRHGVQCEGLNSDRETYEKQSLKKKRSSFLGNERPSDKVGKGQLATKTVTKLQERHSSAGLMYQRLSSGSQGSLETFELAKKHSQHHESIGKSNNPKQLNPGFMSSPTESEVCGSSLGGSVCSGTKNSSRRTDATSTGTAPLQVDSTHTQLSWASVALGSSLTQTFALRNRGRMRIRLLVCSSNPAFKLMGERGESLSELNMTLHSEETRRIHVTFTPSQLGPSTGKLIIRRLSTSESSSSSALSGDRRLIPLFAYGGVAELSIDGASKDRWSQLFLNMCMAESDIPDVDSTHDIQQMVAYFSVKNTGAVSAFVCLQVATELPFEDCGINISPTTILLAPGQSERICVRFEPDFDVLLWLNSKAEDMQLLANLSLLWSELAVWQRIRRVFLKNYTSKDTGPLSSWGILYLGDLGVANELRDKQSAETVLSQAVHRIKIAILVEREKLSMFDLDSTLVFQQLDANETAMLVSPPEVDVKTSSLLGRDSPLLSGNLHGVQRKSSESDYKLSGAMAPSYSDVGYAAWAGCFGSNFVIDTTIKPDRDELCIVRFPKTMSSHKSSVKIRFQNPSTDCCEVSADGASPPFIVSTSNFIVQANSYFVMRVLFKPMKVGLYNCNLNIFINGKKIRCYMFEGEGV